MKTPRLADAEWEVMKALWRRGPGARGATAAEVAAELEAPTGWSAATTKTLLNRLLKKGLLRFEKEGKAYLYFPARTEAECQGAAADTFLRRVFDGSLSPLLAHFAASRKLTRAELDGLEKVLRDAQAGKGRK